MNALLQEVGDYDVRGHDFETAMVCGVTSTHIDADRLVRMDWKNGFPNWELARTAYCGDSCHLPALRQWVVAFAIAYCMDGGVKREAYSDELACVAGWDALYLLVFKREIMPYTVLADDLGVHRNTYRRLRNAICRRLAKSLAEYWERFGIAFRQVAFYERRCGSQIQRGTLKVRGVVPSEGELARGGDGNFRRVPSRDSDTL